MTPNYAEIFSIVANQVMVKRWKLIIKLENIEKKTNYFEENENFRTIVIRYVRSAIKAHINC